MDYIASWFKNGRKQLGNVNLSPVSKLRLVAMQSHCFRKASALKQSVLVIIFSTLNRFGFGQNVSQVRWKSIFRKAVVVRFLFFFGLQPLQFISHYIMAHCNNAQDAIVFEIQQILCLFLKKSCQNMLFQLQNLSSKAITC